MSKRPGSRSEAANGVAQECLVDHLNREASNWYINGLVVQYFAHISIALALGVALIANIRSTGLTGAEDRVELMSGGEL